MTLLKSSFVFLSKPISDNEKEGKKQIYVKKYLASNTGGKLLNVLQKSCIENV